jgi:phenylalanyl-tRNA synthetase beta chain
MKFSEQWLREWVDPALDTQALVDRLTMAGLEVDAVAPVAPAFDGVVVGSVLEVEPHPEADRLRVCRVDAGAAPLTIVCGAANVAAGMRAPVARVGATLPDGTVIAHAKLRGVESAGMLCSAKELGLGEAGEGLMRLPEDATPGTDLRALLRLDDVSIELGLTPNRGDCLGIAGIAREVGVLCRAGVTAPSFEPVPPSIGDTLPVELQSPVDCPRYLGRVIRGIDPAASTPSWMQERLRRSGLRSLGAVVDITNYLLLELGQPMHAFDLDRIDGGIRVRHAREGESLTLLDGRRLALEPDLLVIADHRQALALAGIMGGADSAVGDKTDALFLECAWFAPQALSGRARRLGLHTDSSHRFERGVDFELQRRAIERATRLILETAGGQAGPVIDASAPEHLPQRPPVRLRAQRLQQLLGYPIDHAVVGDILDRLGMQAVYDRQSDAWQVTPPSFRFDIAIEADLIEEVARVHGYENIPARSPRAGLRIRAPAANDERIGEARRLLAARGYQEIVTYSFVDAESQQLFDPGLAPLMLANPISADTSVMRTSLWPGLVRACRYNLNRQQGRMLLFEIGSKYLSQDNVINEENVIAGLACGDADPEQWGLPARAVDFHDVKADVEALLAKVGGRLRWRYTPAPHPALHPGQSARIGDAQDKLVGWIGSLHPRLLQRVDIDRNIVVFELFADRIATPALPAFHELSRYPAVRRDLALIVDEAVAAGDVLDCVREAAGVLLLKLTLFDIYRGKGVDSGKKSMALGLTLQDFSRTLTDGETEVLIATVLKRLQDRFGATLRE